MMTDSDIYGILYVWLQGSAHEITVEDCTKFILRLKMENIKWSDMKAWAGTQQVEQDAAKFLSAW